MNASGDNMVLDRENLLAQGHSIKCNPLSLGNLRQGSISKSKAKVDQVTSPIHQKIVLSTNHSILDELP